MQRVSSRRACSEVAWRACVKAEHEPWACSLVTQFSDAATSLGVAWSQWSRVCSPWEPMGPHGVMTLA